MTKVEARQGESTLNVSRTNHRNSSTLSTFLKALENKIDSCNFFYQYCAKCSKVNAIIASQTDETRSLLSLRPLKRIAVQLRAPLFVVTHQPNDVSGEYTVDITEYRRDRTVVEHEALSWREMNELLHGQQLSHEEHSGTCSSYQNVWANRENSMNLEEDVSVSNAIREIPGVRHLDMDAAVLCKKCGQAALLIEASSDPNIKVYMTQKMSKALKTDTALIVHKRGDVQHKESVTLKGWSSGGYQYLDSAGAKWGHVERLITEVVMKTHYSNVCTKN